MLIGEYHTGINFWDKSSISLIGFRQRKPPPLFLLVILYGRHSVRARPEELPLPVLHPKPRPSLRTLAKLGILYGRGRIKYPRPFITWLPRPISAHPAKLGILYGRGRIKYPHPFITWLPRPISAHPRKTRHSVRARPNQVSPPVQHPKPRPSLRIDRLTHHHLQIIILILIQPSPRILRNIPPNPFQILVIPDNMLIIIAMPHRTP